MLQFSRWHSIRQRTCVGSPGSGRSRNGGGRYAQIFLKTAANEAWQGILISGVGDQLATTRLAIQHRIAAQKVYALAD